MLFGEVEIISILYQATIKVRLSAILKVLAQEIHKFQKLVHSQIMSMLSGKNLIPILKLVIPQATTMVRHLDLL